MTPPTDAGRGGEGVRLIQLAANDGTRLVADEIGAGAQTVCYLAPHPMDARVLRQEPSTAHLLARLRQHCRVLLPQARGSGASDTAGPYHLRQLAGDIAATLHEAGVASALLWGRRHGGALGLALARYHPELVAGVVLQGAMITPLVEAFFAAHPYRAGEAIDEAKLRVAIAESFAARFPDRGARELQELRDRFQGQAPLAVWHESLAHVVSTMTDPASAMPLWTVPQPLLLVLGETGTPSESETQFRMMRRLAPDAESIPGADLTGLPEEAADELHDRVFAWWERKAPQSPSLPK